MAIRLLPVNNDDQIRQWAAQEENAEFFRRMPPVNMWPADTAAWWVTTYYVQRLEDEKMLGLLGYTNIDQFHRHIEFGLMLDKEACQPQTRREVAVDALKQAMDYIFLYLGFEKAFSKTLAHRGGIFQGYEQYGLNRDGILRSNCFFKGKFHDEVVYSLLRSEWLKEAA